MKIVWITTIAGKQHPSKHLILECSDLCSLPLSSYDSLKTCLSENKELFKEEYDFLNELIESVNPNNMIIAYQIMTSK